MYDQSLYDEMREFETIAARIEELTAELRRQNHPSHRRVNDTILVPFRRTVSRVIAKGDVNEARPLIIRRKL